MLHSGTPPPNQHAFASLIDALSKSNRLGDAARALELMCDAGIHPDVVTFTALIRGFCKNRMVERAWEIFQEMIKSNRCQPDCFLYGVLIDGYCKELRMDRALELLREMRVERRIQPDVVIYNSIVDGLCRSNRFLEAWKFLDETMVRQGCSPTVVTYTSLIRGACKAKKMKLAMTIWNAMLERKIQPTIVSYSVIIDGLSKAGRVYDAYRVVREMETLGCELNVVIYTTLIDGLCKSGFLDDAYALYRIMKRSGAFPNQRTYATLIDTFCRNDRTETALGLFDHIRDYCPLDVAMYTAVVSGLCRERRLDDARALFREMRLAGVSADTHAYNVLLHGAFRSGRSEEAFRILEELGDDPGCVANLLTYNTVIAGCCLESGMVLFYEMRQRGIAPDFATYSALIDRLLGSGEIRRAFDLCEEMLASGLSPPSGVLGRVVARLCWSRRGDLAAKLIEMAMAVDDTASFSLPWDDEDGAAQDEDSQREELGSIKDGAMQEEPVP
ncbi:hypothetical protein SELMODRAFT_77006 [Selaginella moellendorffii]|uniref:Pentacotripeptide-repeat region of PRORP domain-containing protein n=2 Tax=Selaginella moellendorffii TaxID=88036 RepID=D8QTY8_SELML|nr:hypothetical protein SELMODRAFT_77006 [Selaginella moellendorffii]